jgi:hypothetical protein
VVSRLCADAAPHVFGLRIGNKLFPIPLGWRNEAGRQVAMLGQLMRSSGTGSAIGLYASVDFDPLQNSAATRSLRVGIWGAFRPALREPWVPARLMALEMSSSDGQRGIRLDTFCRIIMLESAENSDRECHQSNSGNRQVGQ